MFCLLAVPGTSFAGKVSLDFLFETHGATKCVSLRKNAYENARTNAQDYVVDELFYDATTAMPPALSKLDIKALILRANELALNGAREGWDMVGKDTTYAKINKKVFGLDDFNAKTTANLSAGSANFNALNLTSDTCWALAIGLDSDVLLGQIAAKMYETPASRKGNDVLQFAKTFPEFIDAVTKKILPKIMACDTDDAAATSFARWVFTTYLPKRHALLSSLDAKYRMKDPASQTLTKYDVTEFSAREKIHTAFLYEIRENFMRDKIVDRVSKLTKAATDAKITVILGHLHEPGVLNPLREKFGSNDEVTVTSQKCAD